MAVEILIVAILKVSKGMVLESEERHSQTGGGRSVQAGFPPSGYPQPFDKLTRH
jgi:hypothetical protein